MDEAVPVDDLLRARVIATMVLRSEMQLGIEPTDETKGARIRRVLRTAMIRNLDPQLYAALWMCREMH